MSQLQDALAEIAEIDEKIKDLMDDVEKLKERRGALEEIAIRRITEERLEGVKAAGRSWRVEWNHTCSVPKDQKELVLRAAAKEGIVDVATQINTRGLAAWLTERAKDAGTDARALYSDGTAFEGLVGEFVAPKLRFVAAR